MTIFKPLISNNFQQLRRNEGTKSKIFFSTYVGDIFIYEAFTMFYDKKID